MKKFMYILLIIIVMFINTGNCYAKPKKDYEFAFDVSHFTSPSFNEIMKKIDDKQIQGYWLYINGTYYPKKDDIWTYSSARSTDPNDGDHYVTFYNGDVTKIAFTDDNKAASVYKKIENYWGDIRKSYCEKPKDEYDKNLCNKLTKEVDNTSANNSGDEGKTCDYTFSNIGSGSTISFKIYINKSAEGMSAYSTDIDGRVSDSEPQYIDLQFNNSSSRLYFHEKKVEKIKTDLNTYDKFKDAYLKAYKNKTNVNSSKCPILYLLEDKNKEWYTTLNEELCKKPPIEIYTSGTCQTTSGGETQSITYFEAPNFDDLISGDMTTITCKDIIKENGDLQKILKSIVNIVKILVPIALLVLGTLDIAQAIFAGDESKMKKSQSKFMKRLLIALVIFLIPSVLKVILTIANGIWPIISSDLCGIL